jgi:peptidyl-prolyl cis-trans isomerase D
MALSILRRSSQSLLIKVLLGAVALSFIVGFGAMSYVGRTVSKGGQGQQTWVATVDGEQIDVRALLNVERQIEDYYRRQFGDSADSFLAQMDLTTIALGRMVNERVLQSLAGRMGLVVSDTELGGMITKNPAFYNRGQFDRERYVQMLRRQKVSPTDYENDLRRELLGQKLRNLVFSSVKVAESELIQEYQIREEKVSLQFVKLLPERAKQQVAAFPDEELQTFFEKDKAKFEVPEKRKVNYVVFKASDFKGIEVSDEEIGAYYEAKKGTEFTQPEQVQARHILIKAEPDAAEALREAARLKANNLRQQLADGANFVELAKQQSEDDGTKDRGGDLGMFQRGRMVKAFEDAAFSLEPGVISDVVETPFGFHVIEVLNKQDAGVMDLAAATARIRGVLQQQKGKDQALAEAHTAMAELTPGADLLNYGNDHGKEVGSSSTFTATEGIPGIRMGTRAARSVFEMEQGQFSDPFVAGDIVYVFELTNIVEAHAPEFAEVKDEVREALREQRVQELLTLEGVEIITAINAGQSLPAIATARGLELQDTGLFSRQNSSIPKIGVNAELLSAAFALTKEHPVVSRPYASGDGSVVPVLSEKIEPPADGFAAKRAEYYDDMMQDKAELTLQAWIEKAETQISVVRNEEVLAAVIARNKARRAGKDN